VWDESARVAFTDLLPEGHPFPERWYALRDDPAVSMLIAEEDGELLGFTTCGESRDPDASDNVGELRSFFVAAGRWRPARRRGEDRGGLGAPPRGPVPP
jgi:hypothetical protein